MEKRGRYNVKGKVKIEWSSNFAYAIGLIVADGCLSPDSRHILFVSKDLEQIENFLRCLKITIHIGKNFTGHGDNWAYRVQFSDPPFYDFLKSIGIGPAKSLTIQKVNVPHQYFPDFLRGYFDGDGCSYSYWDKRWRSSFMFYISFACGSKKYIDWLRVEIWKRTRLKGHMGQAKKKNVNYQLKYAKKEAIKLFHFMNYNKSDIRLTRKYLKIKESLAIVDQVNGGSMTK